MVDGTDEESTRLTESYMYRGRLIDQKKKKRGFYAGVSASFEEKSMIRS